MRQGHGGRGGLFFQHFFLNPTGGWPPVSVESLPFEESDEGLKCLHPPLFIKDLSVGDIISIDSHHNDQIESWHHLHRSNNSTIWLLRQHEDAHLARRLDEMVRLGCHVVSVDRLGCYAVNVPAELPMSEIDAILDTIDPSETAIAFPSFRHPE